MLLMNLNLLLRSAAQLNTLIVNLRLRTGEERRQQTLCGKRDNFFRKFCLKRHLPFNRSFCKRPKHASNSPVTFVTQASCRPPLPAFLTD